MNRSLRTALLPLLLLPLFTGCLVKSDFYIARERSAFHPDVDSTFVEVHRRNGEGLLLRFRLWRVLDPARFMLAQRDPYHPGSEFDPDDYYATGDIDTDDPLLFAPLAEWESELYDIRYRHSSSRVHLPIAAPGLYVVEARGGGRTSTAVIPVSEIDLVVKQADNRIVAYVAGSLHGERIAGAKVVAGVDENIRAEGITGSDGVAQMRVGDRERDGSRVRSRHVVVAEHNGSVAIALSNPGIQRIDPNEATIHIHTSRPLYSPGDDVAWRAIVRTLDSGGSYRIPSNSDARITLYAPDGTTLFEDTVTLDDIGTVDGRIQMAEGGRRGMHTLRLTSGGSAQQIQFDVAEHQTSGYNVSITMSRAGYAPMEEITGVVESHYFAGDAAAGADVELTIGTAKLMHWYGRRDDPNAWEIAPRDYATVHVGRGKIDHSGRFAFSYRPQLDRNTAYRLLVTARVTDPSRRSVTARSVVPLYPGTPKIELLTDRRIYREGDRGKMTFTTSPTGERVGDSIWLRAQLRRDNCGRASDTIVDKIYRGRFEGPVEIPLQLDSSGVYQTIVEVVERGKVVSREQRSILVLSAAVVGRLDTLSSWTLSKLESACGEWLPREPHWNKSGYSTAAIIPDREEYYPGDTIIALCSVYPSGQDLFLTLEGESVQSYSVERVGGSGAMLKIPVPETSSSLMHIGLFSVSHSNVVSTVESIRVRSGARAMTITTTADSALYSPGDSVRLSIDARDRQGAPLANAEIALAVVDEALYALRADNTPSLFDTYFGPRPNRVGSAHGREFGFARPPGEPQESMPLEPGGRSASRPARSRDRSSRSSSPVAGETSVNAGGPRGDMYPVETIIRDGFEDLAFWAPSVRTDSLGRGVVAFSLPGNLTSWRVTARGVDSDSRMGESRMEITSRRELMARLEAPVYLTEGDSILVAGVVQNHTDNATDVRVRLVGDGVSVAESEQSVRIEAHANARVDFRVSAPSVGEAALALSATTGERSDGERKKFTVMPRAVREASAASLYTAHEDTSGELVLMLPEDALVSSGTMAIRYSSSVTSAALSAIDQLVGYPYGCVEQTMNKFHPVAVIAGTLEDLDIPFDPKLRSELPKMVASGLNRLYHLQHSSGSWGWFRDGGDPTMTAYVLYGMINARSAGFPVESRSFEKGARALRRMLGFAGGSEPRANRNISHAYLLYVASLISPRGDRQVSNRLEEMAAEQALDDFSLANLLLAAVRIGDNQTAQSLARRLEAASKRMGSTRHWRGESRGRRFGSDAVETTAFAIRALLAAGRPYHSLRDAVDWLVAHKQGSGWRSTWHSAVAIDAITDYLKASPELKTDYTLTVKVNGVPVRSTRITAEDNGRKEQIVTIDRSILSTGVNRVTFEKNGIGDLALSASLGYARRVDSFAADSSGFVVSRTYHRLRRTQLDGKWVYAREPFAGELRSGEEMLVTIAIDADDTYEYAMLEDPIPPGFSLVADTEWYSILDTNGRLHPGRPAILKWYGGAEEIRNGIKAFFASTISPERFETSYVVRAELPGTFQIPPAVASLAYFPEIRGSTTSQRVRVR